MITVTDKAKAKVKELVDQSGLDDSYFLRVSVQGGGCSGLSYNLDFDNEEKPGDQFYHAVDRRKSILRLGNLRIAIGQAYS